MPSKERIVYSLSCTECDNRNYHFVRGRRKEKKVDLKKFCSTCGKHIRHKETK